MTARGRAQVIVGVVGAFLILSGVYHLLTSHDGGEPPAPSPSSSSSPAQS